MDGRPILIQEVRHALDVPTYFYEETLSRAEQKYQKRSWMSVTTVRSFPLSCDIMAQTCFFPFKPMILLCLCCTTVMPVSSTLNNLCGEKLIFSISFSNMSKNCVKPFNSRSRYCLWCTYRQVQVPS